MKKIGVIRGGDWEGYENSLKQGADIFSYIQNNFPNKYEAIDIFIDKDGIWHIKGLPITPHDTLHKVDVIWNTAHASVAQVLNNFSIPHVSIGAFSGALKKSREMLREHMRNTDIHMPQHFIIPAYQGDIDGDIQNFAMKKAKEVFEKFSSPWIVKSFNEDIGMGIHVANTYPELVNALIDGAEHGNSLLVEELIAGKEGSVHSLKGFRNDDIYTFGSNNFSLNEKEKLANITKDLHKHLGDAHYLKSDYILTRGGRVYLKDIDFQPDFKDNSHFCESCEHVGTKPHSLFEHILERALL